MGSELMSRGSLGAYRSLALVLLLLALAKLAQPVTYPGGRFEPCLDPAVPACFPTRCIHLYTVPQQYSCQVSLYPKYGFDPLGQQCARPQCVCAVGYHGGSCLPHVDADCFGHSCTPDNATGYSPARAPFGTPQTFVITGVGLSTYAYSDRAKIVQNRSDCSPGAVLAPGTVEVTNLGPADAVDMDTATFTATVAVPGEYTLCYKESTWAYHPVQPVPLVVAGATGFRLSHRGLGMDFAPADDPFQVDIVGFGLLTGLDVVKLVNQTLASSLGGNLTNSSWMCPLGSPAAVFSGSPSLSSTLYSVGIPMPSIPAGNYTLCYQTYGAAWQLLGTLPVYSVPLWYAAAPPQPTLGGLPLGIPLMVNLSGSAAGFDLANDRVELRTTPRVYDPNSQQFVWNSTAGNLSCGAPGALVAPELLPNCSGTVSGTVCTNASFPVTFTIPTNVTKVCYFSARVSRWVELAPLTPTDVLFVRQWWADGFGQPQPSCLTGWVALPGSQPLGCILLPGPLPSSNVSLGNATLVLPALSGANYTVPRTPAVRPAEFELWVRPACAEAPSALLTLADPEGRVVASLDFGCPFLSVNNFLTGLDWSTNGSQAGYDPSAFWHRVAVVMEWKTATVRVNVDNQWASAPSSSAAAAASPAVGFGFVDPMAASVATLVVANQNPTCGLWIAALALQDCFDNADTTGYTQGPSLWAGSGWDV
eukprot:RCo049227